MPGASQAEVCLASTRMAAPLSREALEPAIAPPPWLTVAEDSLGGIMLRQAARDEVLVPFDETRIIDVYSR